MNEDKHFIDACRFAQLVKTPRGDGLLIAGRVFYIEGPEVEKGDLPLNYPNLFVRALRDPSSVTAVNSGSLRGGYVDGSLLGVVQGGAA